VASLIAKSGNHDVTARQLYVAAGWTMLAGAAVSVLAALTGFIDGYTSSEAGTQARRTINAHAVVMVTVTVLVLLELALRFFSYSDRGSTPGLIVVLSIIVALGVSFGATIGGTLVFDYGFNVETAGDHPAWHVSERDVYPADKDKPAGDVAG
jgi:uncharacterized membrane protein